MRGKKKSNEVMFAVLAVIILVGLALLSVVLGVPPLSESAMLIGPSR
jgi:hypothetical protein